MTNIFLTSAEFVRSMTNISENVQDKYIQSAIRESQDVDLQEVIGTKLYEKLKGLVDSGTTNDSSNTAYKNLLTECQYYLAYATIEKLIPITTFKISNFGASQTTDENMQNLSVNDTFKIEKYYTDKKDFYCKRLQDYLLEHSTELPELNDSNIYGMQRNTYSAASCGLNLGGKRGKGCLNKVYHIGYDKPNN